MNKHYSFAAISVFAIIALAACSSSPPAPTSAPPAAPANPTTAPASGNPSVVTITMGPGRDADQSPGSIVLTAQGDKTQVVVSFKAATPGIEQPGHIHEGVCPGVGAVKIPLSNAVDGKSTTVVNSSLKDLMGGGYSINYHKSTSELGTYVACGTLK